MRLAIASLALLITACTTDYAPGALSFRTESGERVTLGPTSNYDSIPGGTYATFPSIDHHDSNPDVTTPHAIVPFTPWTLGALQSSGSFYDDSGSRSISLSLVTERIRWTGDSHHPFLHEGRVEGGSLAGDPIVDGSFEVGEGDCGNSILSKSQAYCGGNWIRHEGSLVFEEATWTSTCPGAVDEVVFSEGATVEYTPSRLDAGATRFECMDTTPRGGSSSQGDIEYEGGPYACGGNQVVTVDGCRWEVSVFAGALPDNRTMAPYLQVQAAVVDGSCELQTCSASLVSATWVNKPE